MFLLISIIDKEKPSFSGFSKVPLMIYLNLILPRRQFFSSGNSILCCHINQYFMMKQNHETYNNLF